MHYEITINPGIPDVLCSLLFPNEDFLYIYFHYCNYNHIWNLDNILLRNYVNQNRATIFICNRNLYIFISNRKTCRYLQCSVLFTACMFVCCSSTPRSLANWCMYPTVKGISVFHWNIIDTHKNLRSILMNFVQRNIIWKNNL